MNEKNLTEMIKQALQSENTVITDVDRVPGGMTNVSYFATINGAEYLVRLAGRGTDELIDREAEKSNLEFGTSLGLNPASIYFNVKNGMKITDKINQPITLTPERAREANTMKQMISLFQCLHRSEKKMENRFDLFETMNHYEQLLAPLNPFILELISPLKQDIIDLKDVYESFCVEETPCHIDAVCSNLVRSGSDELFLIDWEYSGMFDPLWDIATLFQSFQFTDEEEFFFLTYYLGREPYDVELQRILMHTIFQDYLWSLWSFYKDAKGDDFGSIGMERLERASENVSFYKTEYQEDIVV